MAKRTHNDDVRDVMRAAEEAITAAMADGQHKYEAGDWLTHSAEEHLDHAGRIWKICSKLMKGRPMKNSARR
jgi:hypothetical protein